MWTVDFVVLVGVDCVDLLSVDCGLCGLGKCGLWTLLVWTVDFVYLPVWTV